VCWSMARADRYQPEAGAARGMNFPAREQCSTYCRAARTWPPASPAPDFAAYAESFGARGYRINSASDLLPALTEALAADTVSVITCPVDYSENLRLTAALGDLTGPF
jgi:thiamine pyrophosphate-dependent acetolactate synthase large subunit-like protein